MVKKLGRARVRIAILSRMIRIYHNKKVTIGQRLAKSKGIVFLVIWKKSIPDRGNSQGKGSQTRMFPKLLEKQPKYECIVKRKAAGDKFREGRRNMSLSGIEHTYTFILTGKSLVDSEQRRDLSVIAFPIIVPSCSSAYKWRKGMKERNEARRPERRLLKQSR